ncbi:MAG: 23S rRNA (pseudouridine(1915)-N(3))-methyltransferase RlmH [Alistipes sp.]|jgi:23S rRNA (pseudouridine1915-N3)-methyltransferase|nr:23S rRNA (pseudouridine(1915)-N(3))-methyltransferase RlmH [Alistipes sp.]MBQ5924778.1 23S rRNA (pseudouridine(1915)-N(3))-methyltransferase RlmH [Alistipes sp.]MBR5819077.1 23S rRNA (pseudouridine(1915)-N(3))-methyltransferase RlmH [Alistipes sp.]MEE1147718.1 23S rRNA (pseudouridine(1915)-N(3))-methyltransferase RlmH [Alistipes sp.]
MNVELIVVGKTDMKEVETLVAMYTKRINHYVRFAITTLADIRNTRKLSESEQKRLEGEAILRLISDSDHLTLLDEHGAEYRSIEFAEVLQRRMSSGVKRLVFVIGGPYGFSDAVYQRANSKISLSKMTFSHQIVRAIFTEQLYRAFTILKNEPYHHE